VVDTPDLEVELPRRHGPKLAWPHRCSFETPEDLLLEAVEAIDGRSRFVDRPTVSISPSWWRDHIDEA